MVDISLDDKITASKVVPSREDTWYLIAYRPLRFVLLGSKASGNSAYPKIIGKNVYLPLSVSNSIETYIHI